MRMSELLNEVRRFELDEGFSPREIKMAIGIASDPRYAKGNMTGAVKAIEKMKKGLSDHPQVAAVLKRQNEDVDLDEMDMKFVLINMHGKVQGYASNKKDALDMRRRTKSTMHPIKKKITDKTLEKMNALQKTPKELQDLGIIDEAVSMAQQAAIAISKKEKGEKPKDKMDEDGHTDVASAMNNVKVAMSALTKMSGELAKLSPEDALPSWWTNKVAVAVDKLDGMADYLDTQVENVELDEKMISYRVSDKKQQGNVEAKDLKDLMIKLKKMKFVTKHLNISKDRGTPVMKNGEMVEGVQLGEKFTKKDFRDNEDSNHHTENGVEIVNMYGTPAEKKLMAQIAKNHDKNRGISEKEQKLRDAMVKKYYSKLESVNEGTWAMPDSSKKLKGLMQVLKKPIPLGKGGDSAIDVIGNFIGDDELYDDLGDEGDKNPKGDARPFIMKAMKRLKITQKNAEVELDEKYDLYHKDFSSAMQHAYSYAKSKMGITVDPKEIDSKVATGPKKPTEGKTNKYMLKGKGGNLQIQVYNKGGSKPFELNMYKEENNLIAAAVGHLSND